MIKEQIKQNKDFSKHLILNDGIELFTIYKGSQKLEYFLFLNDELLFSGEDYKPSILLDIDSIDALVGLLFFLTLQDGDTDKEFFENYTENQIEFIKSDACYYLNSLVYDFESENSDAMQFFNDSIQE